MITDLWRRKELSENFNKDLENMRNQSELKNIMTKKKFLMSNRGNQHRLDDNRRMDNEFGRQNSGNHPIRKPERTKSCC